LYLLQKFDKSIGPTFSLKGHV